MNQKGMVLSELCRPEDSDLLCAQLEDVNTRWDALHDSSNERQQKLEEALLALGQFQLALEELLVWIKQTNATLDEQLEKEVQGDVKFIEVELAKHKVSPGDSYFDREPNTQVEMRVWSSRCVWPGL